MNAEELRSSLRSFTGTTAYYPHWSRMVAYTDGVKFLADEAGAHWLIDVIASWQPKALKDPDLREFQLWEISVSENQRAVVKCSRDSEDEAFRQEIPYTDLMLDYVRLYVEDHVILLPSEH